MKEELYMRRCFQLALNGKNHAAPNPTVGAVIVYQDRIIGEGYHACCGEAHAEVNAINSVKDQNLLKESTIYVSLEPCSHYGKTPPCADLIISKEIPRVVIGCQDPFSKVAGRGIKKLRDAGIEVAVGVLEKEAKELIKPFITFNTLKRPYILLKWAESADGYLDIKRDSGHPVKLSNPHSSILVHKQRAEYAAIMVGTNTARLDNPSLTTRFWEGKNPIRIVLDKNLNLSETLQLFDGSTPTLVINSIKNEIVSTNLEYIKIDFSKEVLEQIFNILYTKKIQSLMVEGGRELLESFITANYWDEIVIEESEKIINDGVKAPNLDSRDCKIEKHFDHNFLYFYNSKKSR